MGAAVVITARVGSSRLPRKMLLDLEGAPVFEHVVANLRKAQAAEELVLATTRDPEDDELAALAGALGVSVFRGPTQDVIERWRQAAEARGADFVVCCDGDDVMLDVTYVDRVIAHHAATGDDYVVCDGLPFGTAPTGYARSLLERVCSSKVATDTEGQARFFTDASVKSRGVLRAPEHLRCDGARLTLDYPEDLEFFAAVVRELGMAPPLERVVSLLASRPDIIAINAGRQEEYWRRFHERYPPIEVAGS